MEDDIVKTIGKIFAKIFQPTSSAVSAGRYASYGWLYFCNIRTFCQFSRHYNPSINKKAKPLAAFPSSGAKRLPTFRFPQSPFFLNNKYSRYCLNDKVFICAGRLKVYFFEILKRYFVLLLSLYFAIRVESNMVKHRFAKACARYVHGVVPYPSIQSSPFFSAGGIDSKRPHGFIPYGRWV